MNNFNNILIALIILLAIPACGGGGGGGDGDDDDDNGDDSGAIVITDTHQVLAFNDLGMHCADLCMCRSKPAVICRCSALERESRYPERFLLDSRSCPWSDAHSSVIR